MIHHLRVSATWLKRGAVLAALIVLAGCIDGRDLDQPPAELGDFTMGHNIVIAPNLTQGPLSRPATQEEWIASFTKAIDDRFSRYESTDDTRIYHFGISVEGYVLAQVGVPLILQPNSVVIFRLTVWDDAAQAKMNTEPKEITVLEAISGETMAGSGLTQTREQQMENLSILAAKQIEEFLVEQNREANWFNGFVPEGAVVAPTASGAVNTISEGAVPTETAEAATVAPPTEVPMATGLVVEPAEAVTDPEVLAPPGTP